METSYSALQHAGSTEEVVRAIGDYLVSWTDDDISRLPERCRPEQIRTRADIEFWADRLLAESGLAALMADDERRLDGLTNHFLIASVRMRQFRS